MTEGLTNSLIDFAEHLTLQLPTTTVQSDFISLASDATVSTRTGVTLETVEAGYGDEDEVESFPVVGLPLSCVGP